MTKFVHRALVLLLSAILVLCGVTTIIGVRHVHAKAEVQKYVATYGTYVNSGSKEKPFNAEKVFRANDFTSSRIAFLQFDVSDFFNGGGTATKTELVLNLSQAPTSTELTVDFSKNDEWKGGTEKDALLWGDRTAIYNEIEASLQSKYVVPPIEGELRLDITNITDWVTANASDYVLSFRLLAQKSQNIWFHSQNATDETLRPYIEFNRQSTTASHKVTLDVGEGGRILPVAADVVDNEVTVEEGSALQLKVLPDPGYEISELTIDGENAMSRLDKYSVLLSDVSADVSVAARFVAKSDGRIYPTDDFTRARVSTSPISDEDLRVKTAGGVGDTTRISYLKFDLTTYEASKNASLNFYATGGGDWQGNFAITMYGFNFTEWSETDEYTWGSFPLNGLLSVDEANMAVVASATRLGEISIGKSAAWYTFDLSGWLREQKMLGASEVTLAMVGSKVTGSYAVVRSKDSTEVDTIGGELTRPYIDTAPLTYSVTVSPSDNGNVSANSSVARNGNVTVQITPETGFGLSRLVVNGQDVTDKVIDGKYYLNNVTADVTVSAEFASEFVVEINVSDNLAVYDGQGNRITGEIGVPTGSEIGLFFVPDNGYRAEVKINGQPTDKFRHNRLTMTVTQAMTLNATATSIL